MSIQNLTEEGISLFKNKKFDEAITKLNQALDQIKDKDSEIQEQIDIQFWLGRCYSEQAMKANGKDAEQLFGLAIKHHQQQLMLAKQLEGENGIQKQIYVQFSLGCCYLEQAMKANGKDAEQLFGQAVEHYQQQLRLAEQLEELEGENGIQKQIDAQFSLGHCYFEQAMKAKGKDSKKLFKQAVEHFQKQLNLAKKLEDKQNSTQEQINAQFSLGRCYLERAKKAKEKDAEQLFGQAVDHFQQSLEFTKQLTDEQNRFQKQINAQSWLGECYLEQAIKANGKGAKQLFEQAVEHFQQQLNLAKKLEDKQNSAQEQINAQFFLGDCYLEQAKRAKGKDSEQLFGQAVEHHQQQLNLAIQLEGENGIQKQINVEVGLGYYYLKQAITVKDKRTSLAQILFKQAERYFLSAANRSSQLIDMPETEKLKNRINELLKESYFLQKKWPDYFEQKKKDIWKKLFDNEEDDLTDAISTILAILNISPIELGSTPLAHYTSPSVCEKLFGIVHDKNDVNNKEKDPVDKQQATSMRISSSTYMNDPTEGEGLLELLDLQDLELENKVDCPEYNAFFACFSSRVNDLNQFRLYGKENGVEASGCCLVFNKDGNWLREPDVSFSFRSMAEKGDEYSREQPIEADISNADLEDANLPLYQVAYIAYQDEYLAEDRCSIWLPKNKQKFGIHLEPVGKNPGWHQLRIRKLKEALIELMGKSNDISDEDREALEYIRYLFKDFAFRDEEEFRLLKIEKIGSDKIEHCETTQSIYLPYADARDIVDEVILGTNYEKSGKGRKAEAFQHLMRKHYPNVKVSRSSLPINANPPIKKD